MKKFVILILLMVMATPLSAQKVAVYADLLNLKARNANPLVTFRMAVNSTFWRDSTTVAALSLTSDQQKKMDEIFQQYRLKLIDLNAALEKDELILAPMIEALPAGDEARILAQIDRVAQDRTELEKANSRMLLQLLQSLTPEQWTKLRDRRLTKWD